MTVVAPPRLDVSVDGTPLGEEPERNLRSIVVVDNRNIPDAFELTFVDQYRALLTGTGIRIGSVVEVVAGDDTLVHGEVTALEASYEPGIGTFTIVRGLDHSHRLFRGRKTRTFNNEPYSEIARTVAEEAGLDIGTIDATPAPAPDDHVSQANVTDWQFIRWLAANANRVAAVRDGRFELRTPEDAADAPAAGSYDTGEPRLLTFGHNLLRFRTVVTSAEQVEEVEVRGWHVGNKEPLVATAPARTTSAELSQAPDELAATFGSGSRLVATDTPYGDGADLDTVAVGLADEVAGAFAEFEGVALGSSALRSGAKVRLQDAGDPFDGTYVVTTSEHRWEPETGYRTTFAVTGRQDRTLLGLAAPGVTAGAPTPAGPRIAGVVIGVVTDTHDDQGRCRVKLRFPWLSDDYESDWARTVQFGAGADRGALFVPEVDDEVLVAFEQGDVRRPFVLGGLYNGVDQPRTGDYVDGSSGEIVVREFVSRQGHVLRFDDRQGSDEGISLVTADGSCVVHLDQAGSTISMTADAGGATVAIASKGEVTVKADGDVKVEGRSVEITASTSTKIKGSTVSIEGSGPVEIKGNPIKLN